MDIRRNSVINPNGSNIVKVPHLGGIDVAFRIPKPFVSSKPTVILINSFATSSELYRDQFKDQRLTDAMNLIAIEVLGHGDTRSRSENFTYWDSAIMNIQAMDALGIKKAFVLGTSQGGWIAVRMALYAPDRILGLMPLGTSMDFESERSRKLGCWSAQDGLSPAIHLMTSTEPIPSWEPPNEFCHQIVASGMGEQSSQEIHEFWRRLLKQYYGGDDGRRRLRQATINLRDRDGLHGRLIDIRCPIWWMHGDADVVYSVANAEEEIKMFERSSDAKLTIVKGGYDYLSCSNPAEVNNALLEFIGKHHQGDKKEARKLREAVGMVEM